MKWMSFKFFLQSAHTAPQHMGTERKKKKSTGAAGIDLRTEFGRKRRYLIRIAISEGRAKQKRWNKSWQNQLKSWQRLTQLLFHADHAVPGRMFSVTSQVLPLLPTEARDPHPCLSQASFLQRAINSTHLWRGGCLQFMWAVGILFSAEHTEPSCVSSRVFIWPPLLKRFNGLLRHNPHKIMQAKAEQLILIGNSAYWLQREFGDWVEIWKIQV